MTHPMALEGVRVVCFGMGGAAPLATATLGDFGAEIFKIEPRTGDWSRTTPGLGTREILLKVGLSEAEITKLETDKVIAVYRAA